MAELTRKEFLAGTAALAALRPSVMFGADAQGSVPPARLRFGIISDVHVRNASGQFGTEHLVKALSWFRVRAAESFGKAGEAIFSDAIRL